MHSQALDNDITESLSINLIDKKSKCLALKGKPYMVPPSLDPFMFSEEESALPSVSKSAKYNTFNSWPVSNNASSRNTTYGNQRQSFVVQTQRLG